MTELRKQMIECMVFRGLSENTQKAYVHVVKMLARYYKLSPEKLSEKDIKEYFTFLIKKEDIAPSTLILHLCGIKFFYERTLNREWKFFKLAKPRKRLKIPEVLSEEEVKNLLAHIKSPILRMCSIMLYSCGLRVSEGCNLKMKNIDTSRMLVVIRDSKGGRDRLVPLPEKTFHLVKKYHESQNPCEWLFPQKHNPKPISRTTLYAMLKLAAKESGIEKNVSPHTLRHSYATHLLEHGVSIQIVQELLGHKSIRTTYLYIHMTSKSRQQTLAALNELMENL